ncbi:MAG: aspartate racemase [Proteobacteria bacterium]|nr:MAG: aspartate racemase [Pseudomonadota bacterium]
MKQIGLLGGMSWASTAVYYERINRIISAKMGGLHSAKIVVYSVDFSEIAYLQRDGRWEEAAAILIEAAKRIEAAGADFLLICTNTMHKLADLIQAQLNIPLLHLIDATAEEITRRGCKKVGLLGTRFTMEEGFYKGRLETQHGLQVIVPDEDSRRTVHRIIYDELCTGEIHDGSRSQYIGIINDLCTQGAEGIILGCTEIGLLIKQEHVDVQLFDTTEIHCEHAVYLALDGQ